MRNDRWLAKLSPRRRSRGAKATALAGRSLLKQAEFGDEWDHSAVSTVFHPAPVAHHALLAIVATVAVFWVLLPLAAAAHGTVARTETATLGLTTVQVEYSVNTLTVGTGATIMLHAKAGALNGLQASLRPGPGVDATVVRAPVSVTPDGGTATIRVTAPVKGNWTLAVSGAGGTLVLPLQASPHWTVPVWLGWLMGLSPLAGLAAFAAYQWRRVQRLPARRAESAA